MDTTDTTITTTLSVTGMTCGHCVVSVSESIQEIAGVTDVTVDLVRGGASQVTVRSASPLDPDGLATAITAAGYALA